MVQWTILSMAELLVQPNLDHSSVTNTVVDDRDISLIYSYKILNALSKNQELDMVYQNCGT